MLLVFNELKIFFDQYGHFSEVVKCMVVGCVVTASASD